MKELLYIPSGSYYRFSGGKISFSEFNKSPSMPENLFRTDEELINLIISLNY